MTRPTIAVVVPAFRATRFLPSLFDSIRAQELEFDEVIVCDDASGDDTASLAESLGARVMRRTENGGCSAAKNSGLAAVRSDWVHFHDADDGFGGEFLARARARLESDGENLDVLLFDVEQRDATSGQILARTALARSDLSLDPERYLVRHTVNNCGIYRTEFLRRIGGFPCDPATLYNEDRMFHLSLAMNGARFLVEDYIGYISYAWPNSMSHANQLRCLQASLAVCDHYAAQRPGANRDALGDMYWHLAAGLAAHDDLPSALKAADKAVACGLSRPNDSSRLFRILCAIDHRMAIRFRESMIRWLKPRLRRHLSAHGSS